MAQTLPQPDVNQLDSTCLNCPMNSQAIAIPNGNSWVKALPNWAGTVGPICFVGRRGLIPPSGKRDHEGTLERLY